MKKYLCFVFIAILLQVSNAEAIKVRPFHSIAGGSTTGSIKKFPVAELSDDDIAIGVVGDLLRIYQFHSTATDADDGDKFLRPDDYSTQGVWYLVDMRALSYQSYPKDDSYLYFDPATAGESEMWIGMNHDSEGDDDDGLEVRDSATPGSNVFMGFYQDSGGWVWLNNEMYSSSAIIMGNNIPFKGKDTGAAEQSLLVLDSNDNTRLMSKVGETIELLENDGDEVLYFDLDTTIDNQVEIGTTTGVTDLWVSGMSFSIDNDKYLRGRDIGGTAQPILGIFTDDDTYLMSKVGETIKLSETDGNEVLYFDLDITADNEIEIGSTSEANYLNFNSMFLSLSNAYFYTGRDTGGTAVNLLAISTGDDTLLRSKSGERIVFQDNTTTIAELDSATGFTVTSGVLAGKVPYVVNSGTSTYNVTTAQARAGTFFLTTNAATTTYVLPAAEAGMAVCARMGQGNSQILRIDTDGTDYIVKLTGGRTSAAGDYYGGTASTSNQVCVMAFNATDWYVTSEVGTWTEQ